MIYLDTHAAVYLSAGQAQLFGKAARRALETGDRRLSPAAFLELSFLFEIGRISSSAENIVADLTRDFGISVCTMPFPRIARAACHETWTRDPFDRLIVAHAREARGKLVTKDERIAAAYPDAIW